MSRCCSWRAAHFFTAQVLEKVGYDELVVVFGSNTRCVLMLNFGVAAFGDGGLEAVQKTKLGTD